MSEFKDIKIGDKLWGFRNGWGEVIDITCNDNTYPIKVQFMSGAYTYTLEGKVCSADLFPDLYYDEIKFEIPKKPLPKLAVDTKVVVWDDKLKCKRYFSHFDEDGTIYCFQDGATSWSSTYTDAWSSWELADDTPGK